MANEPLLRALEECRARQWANQAEERRRMALATSKNPRIGELDAMRREDILDGLRRAMDGVKPEGIVERTRARNAEIAQLLKESGFPGDFLDPVYQCRACRDTGYTGESRKALCACVRARELELISGEEESPDSPCFENFDICVFPDTVLDRDGTTQRMLWGAIRARCEQFSNLVPKAQLNLLLYGPSGLGKTYLLKCIKRRASQRGVETMSLSANTLLNLIRQAYFAREEEVSQPYYDVPLLLIDDLGTEPMWENITLEQLFALIEYRMDHRKTTVFSTNLTPDNIRERYTRRIHSRLMDRNLSLVLQFQGQDVRLIPRANGKAVRDA